jgi:hypothetical protein
MLLSVLVRRSPTRAFALLVTAGAAVGACSTILGVEDYRVAPPTPKEAGARLEAGREAGTPSIRFADANCEQCVTKNCGPEFQACKDDPLCGAWEARAAQCAPTNDGCVHKAFVQAGRTDAAVGALVVCSDRRCFDQCGAMNSPSYGPRCATAIKEKMDPVAAASIREDPAANDFYRCWFAKNCVLPIGPPTTVDAAAAPAGYAGNRNPSCLWECVDPNGVYEPVPVAGQDGGLAPGAVVNLSIWTFTGAYNECGAADLSCVEHYGWVPSTSAYIKVTVFASTAGFPEIPGTPVPGLTVRACLQTDEACAGQVDPRANGGPLTTDGDGRATFTLPTNITGQTWYFEVTPTDWHGGPKHVLFNTGRRLVRDALIPLTISDEVRALTETTSTITQGTWQPGSAALRAWPRTCMNLLARGLAIDVEQPTGSRPVQVYQTAAGILAPVPDASAFAAVAWNLAPGRRWVTARDPVTNRVIAREQVILKADSLTVLNWLEPKREPGSAE